MSVIKSFFSSRFHLLIVRGFAPVRVPLLTIHHCLCLQSSAGVMQQGFMYFEVP